MRPLAFVAVGLALAAAQSALLRWVGGGAVPLQLLVPYVAWIALEAENVEGVVAAAGVGYAMDLHAGTPAGLHGFLAVALFLLARGAGVAVDVRGRGGFAVLSAVGCLAVSLGGMALQRGFGLPEAAPTGALVPRALLEALLTGAAAPLVALGLERLDGLLGREEPGIVP